MTITLDLPAEVQAALTHAARTQGTTPERLALDGLRRLFLASPNHASHRSEPDEQNWEDRLRALAMTDLPSHASRLTPADFDRDSLYED